MIFCVGSGRGAGLPPRRGRRWAAGLAGSTGGIFGQWLSGMARMYKATNDVPLRDKALRLMTEWAKTIGADGNSHMGHYAFEKIVCGLTDLKLYAGSDEAMAILEKICDYGMKNMNHNNVAAPRGGNSGQPSEWYTMAENLYRAYQVSGKELFNDVWGYVDLSCVLGQVCGDGKLPDSANGVHAYSHVNIVFEPRRWRYAVTGEEQYLNVIKNAYDFLQNVQCYATGGFGPSEFIVTSDGGLGRALDTRTDSFETGCGSWAAFKLTRYLLQFTGDARFGDWAERIIYNGIGAALPVTPEGKNFYYSDYRVEGGMKVYNWEAWTCCSGSYIQAVSDYANVLYYTRMRGTSEGGLYVNLFVPSEVTWKRSTGDVKLTCETEYPNNENVTFTLAMGQGAKFPLKFRVPGWAKDVSVKVNGTATPVEAKAGTWATVDRAWANGDKVELHIPLPLRMVAVDKQHPDPGVAIKVSGGTCAGAGGGVSRSAVPALPATDEELNKLRRWRTQGRGGSECTRGRQECGRREGAGMFPGCSRQTTAVFDRCCGRFIRLKRRIRTRFTLIRRHCPSSIIERMSEELRVSDLSRGMRERNALAAVEEFVARAGGGRGRECRAGFMGRCWMRIGSGRICRRWWRWGCSGDRVCVDGGGAGRRMRRRFTISCGKSAGEGDVVADLGSFTWPGWECEPGFAPTAEQARLGLDAARFNLQLAEELGKPADRKRRKALAAGAQAQLLAECGEGALKEGGGSILSWRCRRSVMGII